MQRGTDTKQTTKTNKQYQVRTKRDEARCEEPDDMNDVAKTKMTETTRQKIKSNIQKTITRKIDSQDNKRPWHQNQKTRP